MTPFISALFALAYCVNNRTVLPLRNLCGSPILLILVKMTKALPPIVYPLRCISNGYQLYPAFLRSANGILSTHSWKCLRSCSRSASSPALLCSKSAVMAFLLLILFPDMNYARSLKRTNIYLFRSKGRSIFDF